MPEMYICFRLVKKIVLAQVSYKKSVFNWLFFPHPKDGGRCSSVMRSSCTPSLLLCLCPHLVFGLQAPWRRAGHDSTAPGMRGHESPAEAHSSPGHILWPSRQPGGGGMLV